jgi:hypothetical protein
MYNGHGLRRRAVIAVEIQWRFQSTFTISTHDFNFVSCFIFKWSLLYNVILTRKGNHIQEKGRREEITVLMIAGLRFCLKFFSRISYFLFVLVIKVPK